ncbi:MAG: hypothetical protein J6Y94_08685 [Bacteriovoracaceae bacterium]|nr:hypothetical protein [Bacteriovoracaceae bacterium]
MTLNLGLLLGWPAAFAQDLTPAWAQLQLPFKASTIKRLQAGESYAKASLKAAATKGEKVFDFAVAGWHPRDCATALPRLTRYEKYNHYLPFVTQSTYQDATQTIDLLFKVWIIPFSLELRFQIPRMTKAGRYPFTFKEGFLPDLKGKVTAQDLEQRCLVLIPAPWQGPDPEINAFLFELFAQTAATKAMEKMLRVTRD